MRTAVCKSGVPGRRGCVVESMVADGAGAAGVPAIQAVYAVLDGPSENIWG